MLLSRTHALPSTSFSTHTKSCLPLWIGTSSFIEPTKPVGMRTTRTMRTESSELTLAVNLGQMDSFFTGAGPSLGGQFDWDISGRSWLWPVSINLSLESIFPCTATLFRRLQVSARYIFYIQNCIRAAFNEQDLAYISTCGQSYYGSGEFSHHTIPAVQGEVSLCVGLERPHGLDLMASTCRLLS